MTVEEFLNKHFQEPDDLVNGKFRDIFKKRLIEFATYHVEQAIYEFSFDKHNMDEEERVKQRINIQNYLENIK
jgi:hypothetical protein